LTAKGKFNNNEVDKKNLFGRVGRLGSCLQGRIFRFYVESRAIKFDTIKKELNSASDPCELSKTIFQLPEEKKRTKILKTYISDKDVKNFITEQNKEKEDNINCFDYFIGYEESNKVQEKLRNKTESEINEIVDALKLSNYNYYKKVVNILAEIYEWQNSADYEISKRMTNIDFTARLFYNVAIGTTIKRLIKNDFEINEKKGKKPYVVIYRNTKSVCFLCPSDFTKFDNFRPYKDNDKNILIYSTLHDISNLIDYRLKIYLQDLYYRLGQLTEKRSYDLESFLMHSIVGNTKKIALKNIGIVDDFAINILCEQPQLFDTEDVPNLEAIVQFAKDLPNNDPIKYAIIDVFGDIK
jgi:hypothetical protein